VDPTVTPGQLAVEFGTFGFEGLHLQGGWEALTDPEAACPGRTTDTGTKWHRYLEGDSVHNRALERQRLVAQGQEVDEYATGESGEQKGWNQDRDREGSRSQGDDRY
jgi:hypothetical protein